MGYNDTISSLREISDRLLPENTSDCGRTTVRRV
jgi:hypothetical protein